MVDETQDPSGPESSRTAFYEYFRKLAQLQKLRPAPPPNGPRYADDPVLCELAGEIVMTVPADLAGYASRVFVGDVYSLSAGAAAAMLFGHPQVRVGAPLDMMINAVAGHWEAELTRRRIRETATHVPLGVTEDVPADEETDQWRDFSLNPDNWAILIGAVMELSQLNSEEPPDEIADRVVELAMKVTLTSTKLQRAEAEWQSDRRGHRYRWAYLWILAHEYGHLLLGHFVDPVNNPWGTAPEHVVAAADAFVKDFVSADPMWPSRVSTDNENHSGEFYADAFGLAVCLGIGSECGPQGLAQIQTLLEGLAIALLVIQLAMGKPSDEPTETHPALGRRLEALVGLLAVHAQDVKVQPEENTGPLGPGLDERLRAAHEYAGDLLRSISARIDAGSIS